jgi:hypothetical protein
LANQALAEWMGRRTVKQAPPRGLAPTVRLPPVTLSAPLTVPGVPLRPASVMPFATVVAPPPIFRTPAAAAPVFEVLATVTFVRFTTVFVPAIFTVPDAVVKALEEFNRMQRVKDLIASFGTLDFASNDEIEAGDMAEIARIEVSAGK